jgi:hypothetical protein
MRIYVFSTKSVRGITFCQKEIASDTFVQELAGGSVKNVGEYSFARCKVRLFLGFIRCIRIPAPKGAKPGISEAKNTIRGREIWVRRSLIREASF